MWKILCGDFGCSKTRAKYHLVELSIFPSYCCAAHQSVKSNNRKGGNNGNDQKGERANIFLLLGCYEMFL